LKGRFHDLESRRQFHPRQGEEKEDDRGLQLLRLTKNELQDGWMLGLTIERQRPCRKTVLLRDQRAFLRHRRFGEGVPPRRQQR